MSQRFKRIIGLVIGLSWAALVLYYGFQAFNHLVLQFGDSFGALSLFFMFGWVAVLFIGRAVLEVVVRQIFSWIDQPIKITDSASATEFQVFEMPRLRLASAAGIFVCVSVGNLGTGGGLMRHAIMTQIEPSTYVTAQPPIAFVVSDGNYA